MHMRQCPKFETCSANLCPLDPDWEKRRHHNGDPVCFYMRESVKHGASLAFLTSGLQEIYEACERVRDPICDKWGVIAHEIDRSRSAGLRMRSRKGFMNESGKGGSGSKLADDHPWKKWCGD